MQMIDKNFVVANKYLDEDFARSLFTDRNGVCEQIEYIDENITLVDLLVKEGIFPSKNAARKQGNWTKEKEIIPNGYNELRIGKLKHMITTYKPTLENDGIYLAGDKSVFLENYELHKEYCVLTQIKREPFQYTEQYVDYYNSFDCTPLSKLRYDFLVKTIGRKPYSILDIGYGNGSFLSYCNEQGINFTYGYDVSPLAPPKTAFRIDDFSKGFYDVISFYDSLEHCDDIGKVIASLAPHNYVVISLPWCRDYLGDWDISGFSNEWFSEWRHRKRDEHLWHFSESSLAVFMTDRGYEYLDGDNPEDAIRKPSEVKAFGDFRDGFIFGSGDQKYFPNILTEIFKKIENVDTTRASTRR